LVWDLVNLTELELALPEVESGGGWRIHPDDVEDMRVVAAAADKIVRGPMLVARAAEEGSLEFVIMPDDRGRVLTAGFYRLVPIDPSSLPEARYWAESGRKPAPSIETGGVRMQAGKTVLTNPQPGGKQQDDEPDLHGDREKIWARVQKNWDFSSIIIKPKMRLTCMCGGSDWHPRYWLFHDYEMQLGGKQSHRFRYRCDISMKCAKCSFVGVWGVIVPEDWWERYEIYPRKITWQEASRMLKSWESTQEEL